MPLAQTTGDISAKGYGMFGGQTGNLVGYWDAGLGSSAPTGANGTLWKDISNAGSKSMGDISIQAYNTDWTYGGSGTGGYVQNSTQRDTNALGTTSGMRVALNNFPKLKGTMWMWVYHTTWTPGDNGYFSNRPNGLANDADWFWWGNWSQGTSFYFRTGYLNTSVTPNTTDCCGSDLSTGANTTLIGSSDPSVKLGTNSWQWIGITWDRLPTTPLANQTKRLYHNGSLWAERVGMPGQPSANHPEGNFGSFGINHGNGTNNNLRGRIAAIRVYNEVLTATQMLADFNALKSRYGY